MKKLLLLFLFLPISIVANSKKTVDIVQYEQVNKSDALLVYEAITKYSFEYDVPMYIVFNIVNKESNYTGPNNLSYKANVGRLYCGPMQLSYYWCSKYSDSTITQHELRTNIDANISLGIKVLRHHYNRFKSWKKACAVYNTGTTKPNKYTYHVLKKDYRKNWLN